MCASYEAGGVASLGNRVAYRAGDLVRRVGVAPEMGGSGMRLPAVFVVGI